MSVWGELKRRNVFKVGAAYLIVAWLIAQVISVINEPLNLPGWFQTVTILLLAIAFPVALIFAWAYELTPEGMRRADSVPVADRMTAVTGRKLDFVIIGFLLLAVGLLIAKNYALDDDEPSQQGVLPNSVAVLPLENLSPDPDDAYFSAGIHEEILNYLGKLESLNVIARPSVLRYANTTKSVQEIAEELSVETIMAGSVRYSNDRVRVAIQLIDPRTGAQLWTQAYERDFADIFAIQADIAMSVADALGTELSISEQNDIEETPTSSSEAYAYYLRARNLSATGNQGPQMLAWLDEAIRRDPDFALAHSLRAGVYAQLLVNSAVGSAGSWEGLETLARESAGRALALDENESLAHYVLADIEIYRWRWSEAREILEMHYDAISEAERRLGFAWLSSWTGNHERAIEMSEQSVQLNPVDWNAHRRAGVVRLWAGDPDAAVTAFQRGIGLSPDVPLQHTFLAYAEIARGNHEEATEELQLAEQLMGPSRPLISLLDTAYGYGRIGRDEDVRRLLDEIETLAERQDIGTGGWAMVYLAIGDETSAIQSLREAAEKARTQEPDAGFLTLMNLRMNVTADPVLEQPEFVEVRNRIRGD